MSRAKKIILWTLALILLAGAIFIVPTIWGKPWSIEHFYARVFIQYALKHPMMLTSMRLLEPMGLRGHNAELDDFSIEFREDEASWRDRQLEIMRRYDRDSMSDGDGLSYDILEWFIADAQTADRFHLHDYPVNQTSGMQTYLTDFMINTHRIDDLKGGEEYVSRLGKFQRALGQIEDGLRVREEKGIVPPRFVVRHVLAEMRGLIEAEPREHLLVTHLETALSELEGVAESEVQNLVGRAEQAVTGSVYPGYQSLIDFMAGQEERATDDNGVWKLPDGEAYYAHTLKHHTTTDMTADEIHVLGLAEVVSIQAEMRAILEAEGYPTEDLGATMKALNEEERFLYPDTDEGREQIMADYQAIVEEIEVATDDFFDVRPNVGVKVVRIPEFTEATATIAYYDSPPLDGSTPGNYFVNLRDVKEIPKFGMRTLSYHEAIPGHHFQIAIAQGLTDLPFFRRVISFTAYVEGWALYAERVAAEQGFQADPYDRLGYLIAQIFRAVRLVVDTGIHSQRWTREEAIDYMLANTGMPEGEVISEIERYIVRPGQACAYKVGQLKILELRRRAMDRLGERFDLKQFHNVVLTNGALPLSLLEQQVELWIQEQEAA